MATTKKRTTTAKPASRRLSAKDKKLRAARVKDVPAHLEIGDDGWTVIVPDWPIAPLTVEQTRAAIELTRR